MKRWWLVGLGAGCGVHDQESFELAFAERWCDRQQECALGDFERAFSSFDDCVDEKEDDLRIPHWEEECELDPDGVDDCLEFLRSTDCEDFEGKEIEEACDHAYDDCH